VNSSSRDGRSQITITFNLDRDLDAAANDVRDAVSRVTSNLPDQADPPQIAKANADASPIIILNLTSTTLNPLELADYADRYLVERMSTIDGVAQANLFGAKIYAMRIWLDANALAARGVTVDDVETALNAQNLELPAGSLGKRLQGLHHPGQPQLRQAGRFRQAAPARRQFQRLRGAAGRCRPDSRKGPTIVARCSAATARTRSASA
jgi:multidrug efflux pump subunit AcrB